MGVLCLAPVWQFANRTLALSAGDRPKGISFLQDLGFPVGLGVGLRVPPAA